MLLTVTVQEARLGLHGIQYPDLSLGDANIASGMPFLSEVVILAIAGVFCVGVITREIDLHPSWYMKWIVGSTYWNSIAILLSYILNIEQSDGGFGTFRMLFEGFVLFAVVCNLPWSAKSLRIIEVLFILVGAFHSLVIALSYYKPAILPFPTNIIQALPYSRYVGLFLQPSRVSFLIGIAFIIAFVRLVSERERWTSVLFYVIALSLLLIGLLLSQTRTIEIAIPIAVIFVLSQLSKPGGRAQVLMRLLIIAGGLALFLAAATLTELGFSRLSDINVNALQTQRGYIWETAIQIILTHPFGTGFAGLFPLSGALAIPHAHNMYLQWGVMFGLPGFILFCLLIVRIFKDSGKRLAGYSTNKRQTISFVALRSAWFLCLLVFVPDVYLITNTGYWFWLFTGLLIAPHTSSEPDRTIK